LQTETNKKQTQHELPQINAKKHHFPAS